MRLVLMMMLTAAGSLTAAQSLSRVGLPTQASMPTVIFTRGAGVHVRQELALPLAQGESRLLLDTAMRETDPASVQLQVLEPAGASVLHHTLGSAGQMTFTVCSPQAAMARLRLGYEITHLKAEISYRMSLNPASNRLALQADLTVRNAGKTNVPRSRLVLPGGHELVTALEVGQTLQQQLFSLPELPYDIHYLYDFTRFKESVRTILTIAGDARDETSLAAGKVRIFAPGAGGVATFVADAAVPYVPRGERIELDLGAAPEVAVLRNRLRGEQVNVRTDVYRKLAMFDLEEDFELELTNRRSSPIVLRVQEHVMGDWQLLKSSHPAERLDSGALEFMVPLTAGAKEKLTYSVKRQNVEP